MQASCFIQLRCTDASTPKYAREGHFLTVSGDQYTDLVVTDTTILRFTAALARLALSDVPPAFFRVQEVGYVHFDNTLECFGWNLFQRSENFMPPVKQGHK